MANIVKIIHSQYETILKYFLYFFIFMFALEHLASVAEVKLNVTSDAAGYLKASLTSFWSKNYWFAMRPIGYPTFIKLLHSNPNLVAGIQSLFYISTWTFFTLYIYNKSYNKFLGFLLGIFILFISIQPEFALWTHHILTESLTFTFIPWILILLYELIITKKKIFFYILLGILIIYSTFRDVNAYYSVSFILTFSILYYNNQIKKFDLFFSSLILIITFIFSTYSAEHAGNKLLSKRWVYPYFNLVGQRFLINTEILEYMKEKGMPINEALIEKKNTWASTRNTGGQWIWYSDPQLKKFRNWVATSGKVTYSKFLIMSPSYTFGTVYKNIDVIMHYDKETRYYLKGYKINNLFHYSKITNKVYYKILTLLLCIIIFISLLQRKSIWNKNTYPIISLLLTIPLLAIITYHGDAMEVARHTLIIPILLNTNLLMLIFVFGNELIQKKV